MDKKRLYEGMVSALGGGPPPGYGVHPQERHFWTDPIVYKVHPLTKREEAVGGLFHRFWKENIQELLQMYQDGWPHVEIVKTAKELWNRQQEESKKDEEIVRQHKESLHSQKKQNVQAIYEQPTAMTGGVMEHGGHPNPEGSQEAPAAPSTPSPSGATPSPAPETLQQAPAPQGQGLMRGLSMLSDKEYLDRLNDFRGRAYSRDAPAASIQQIHRGIKEKSDLYGLGGLRNEVHRFRKSLSSLGEELEEDMLEEEADKPKKSFRVISKGDTTGGERTLTPEQLKKDSEMMFTRKEMGMANSAGTGIHENDKTEGEP